MRKQVTFHGHEVESAKIMDRRLKALGFHPGSYKNERLMVELHQVRFYKNTKTSTYRAFIRKIGDKISLNHFFHFLIADRMGNEKNKDKPIWTQELIKLRKRLSELEADTVHERNLQIDRSQLAKMGFSKQKVGIIIKVLLSIVQKNRTKNNHYDLLRFVNKHFINERQEKQNEIIRGIPD